ncbi:porin [Kriegella sp. EG-1]|nr:porin [Flavobacteriaceae bacterium EG-1]
MKLKYNILGLLLLFLLNSLAQETKTPTFGNGVFNLVGKDSTWTMKVGARMQFLTKVNWDQNEDSGFENLQQDFSIRRARVKFDGFAYSPKLKYKIELGVSNRDISGASEFTSNSPRYILDGVLMWNFYGNFEFWMGQTKLPGNIERVISSGNLQQVNRSLLNSNFTIDRDQGIQIRHLFNLTENFIIKEKLAISQGEGRNITSGNLGGLQHTARLEFFPFGDFRAYIASDLKRIISPKLMLAVTLDHNKDAVKTRSNQGTYMINDIGFFETDINTIFVDVMFKYLGYAFMAEFAHRDATDPLAKNSDGSLTGDIVQIGNGLNLQTGYLLRNNWEVSGRFTNIDFDKTITGLSTQNQYTLGLSKYIVGHKLKIQTDFSYLAEEINKDELMWRLQVDIHF